MKKSGKDPVRISLNDIFVAFVRCFALPHYTTPIAICQRVNCIFGDVPNSGAAGAFQIVIFHRNRFFNLGIVQKQEKNNEKPIDTRVYSEYNLSQ